MATATPPSTPSTNDEARQKVWEMIRDIRVCSMVTMSSTPGADGKLHARPMATIKPEDGYDGKLWFFTRDMSSKVQDIQSHGQVLLSYSEPRDESYVTITGTADIIHDQKRLHELWRAPLRAWFPDGPDDDELALIRVIPEAAEYWDSPSGMFVTAFGYARARLTGNPAVIGEHETLRM